MTETFLGAAVVAAVLVLLALHIAIAVMVVRLLKTVKRAATVVESVVDDAERAVKAVRRLRAPLAWVRTLKKLAGHFTAAEGEEKKR